MSFSITILGSGSAVPMKHRNHSSQVLQYYNHLYLIDCGEGTQHLLREYKIKTNKLDAVFISHLHGDHFLGLYGLLSTLSLLGRNKRLKIFAPSGLREIILVQLKYTNTVLNFKLEFIELTSSKSEIISEEYNLRVKTIPLKHGIYCNGFLFEEIDKPYGLIPEKIPSFISNEQRKQLKRGEDIYKEDQLILNHKEVTNPPKPKYSYAYCSDTAYQESIIPIISGVDVLYHESSFLEKHIDKAEKTNHSTTIQAATIAKFSKVKRLIVSHFSARYTDLTPFVEEVSAVFDNVELAEQGKKIELF